MIGYAVNTRIGQVEFRSPIGRSPGTDRHFDPWSPGPLVEITLEEIEGRTALARLEELREDVATAWRQTTFFLFNPEGWR